MKVLLVSEYFPPIIHGGGEISASLLAKELSKNKIEVHVLTSFFNGLKHFEIIDNVKIYRKLKTGKNPKILIDNVKRRFIKNQIKKEIKKLDIIENYDLIHFLNTTTIVKTKKKSYATINGYTNFCPKRNLWYKEKKTCSGCNPIKYVSCITSSTYIGKMKMPFYIKFNPFAWFFSYYDYIKNKNALNNVNRLIVLSDFIDSLAKKNIYKSKIPNIMELSKSKKKIKLSSKKFKVLFVGGLEKHKGLNLLLDAFKKIKNADLFIAGNKINKKNTSNIFYLGNVNYDSMSSLFSQADIVVIPSLWPEPLSRVMIESLYHGCPIIATYVGGNPEGVKNNVNGFLIESSKNNLSTKLQLLIDNKKLRDKFSKESKKLYKEKFDKNKVIKQIIKYYKN